MKKLSVLLAVLMLSVMTITACGKNDSLADADRETQAQWGLTFYDSSQVKNEDGESETEEATEEATAEENSEGETVEENESEESEEETSAEESLAEEEFYAWATIDVNVRKGPKSSYAAIGILKQNDKIVVLDGTDEWWWKVRFEGQEAYISAQYLTKENPN